MYIYVHCSYIHIQKLAKQGGEVNWGDLGQAAHHPQYIFQRQESQDHPHPLTAPGGCCFCVRGIFNACLKTSLSNTKIIKLSISLIDPVVFLIIELSIY